MWLPLGPFYCDFYFTVSAATPLRRYLPPPRIRSCEVESAFNTMTPSTISKRVSIRPNGTIYIRNKTNITRG